MTCALHQSVGGLPVSKERSKIIFMMSASLTLSSFKISGLILSGPAALPGLRLNRSFKIPLSEISMSGIVCFLFWKSSGTVSGLTLPLSTMSCGFIWANLDKFRGDLEVKTDWNCSLCTLN